MSIQTKLSNIRFTGFTMLTAGVSILIPSTDIAFADHRSNDNWEVQRYQVDESDPEAQREWRSFFSGSSQMRQDIEALGDVRVEDLSIPVLFEVVLDDITQNFGDPRDGGARTHEGLDILALRGTPIITPTDAVVVRIGTGSSAGQYIRTANPGGETFVYMHLDAFREGIEEGDVLSADDIIGYVGDTGNALGGVTHLHFEIRNNGAQDPYPRITRELSLAEKMQSISDLLGGVPDAEQKAQELVANHRAEFEAARAQGIALPEAILVVLNATIRATLETPKSAEALSVGDTGADVVELQEFLIVHTTGPASQRLAAAGATGYFGPITQAALAEYRARVDTQSTDTGNPPDPFASTESAIATPTTAVTKLVFTRDLSLGSTGEDVWRLQVFLNANGFFLVASGAGSLGNETTYFGPRTQAALAKYQTAHGISPAAGYFGPITRAYLLTNTLASTD